MSDSAKLTPTDEAAMGTVTAEVERRPGRSRLVYDKEKRTIVGQPDDNGWMPIETAPRDGSEVILGERGYESWAGFWHDGSENYWKREGWYQECDRGNLLTARPATATHWQPLPNPPKE